MPDIYLLKKPIDRYTLICVMAVLMAAWTAPFALGKGPEDAPLRLTLIDAIRTTVENNLAIKFEAVESKIRETDIEVRESEFDPNILAGISLYKDRRPSASAFAAPEIGDILEEEWNLGLTQKLKLGTEYDLTLKSKFVDTNSTFAGLDPEYETELTLNFTQPLLKDFGRDINETRILIAKNNKGISEANFTGILIDTITKAQNAYWELVYAQEDLKVQMESLELARDFEKRIRAQVRAGTMAPIEILQAQAEVADREEGVIVAENEAAKASDVLKKIMNLKPDLYDWGGPIEPLDQPSFLAEEIDLKAKIATALEKRPDLREMKLNIESENIRVKYNENQIYPTLDLVASLGLNGISGKARSFGFGGDLQQSNYGGRYGKDFARMLSGDYYSWRFGLNVNYPIGNRKAKNDLAASKLRAAKLLYQMKDLEKKIALEVRNGVRDVGTNIKRIDSTRVSKKLAKEKLEAEELKFQSGLSTSFNVLSYQRDLTEQETREIRALIDYNRSLVTLQAIIGETLDVLNIKVE